MKLRCGVHFPVDVGVAEDNVLEAVRAGDCNSPPAVGLNTRLGTRVDAVPVPVIASGGAGCLDHIAAALDDGPRGGQASAALLASLLHDGILTVEAIKADLLSRGLMIRPLEA